MPISPKTTPLLRPVYMDMDFPGSLSSLDFIVIISLVYAGTSPLFSDSLTLSGMTLINLSYFQRSGPTWTPTMMHGRLGRRMGWIQWVQLKSGNGIPDEGPSIKNGLDKKRGGWQRQVVTLHYNLYRSRISLLLSLLGRSRADSYTTTSALSQS